MINYFVLRTALRSEILSHCSLPVALLCISSCCAPCFLCHRQRKAYSLFLACPRSGRPDGRGVSSSQFAFLVFPATQLHKNEQAFEAKEGPASGVCAPLRTPKISSAQVMWKWDTPHQSTPTCTERVAANMQIEMTATPCGSFFAKKGAKLPVATGG